MREIKIRAKPDKAYFFESDIRASPSIGEAAYAKGQVRRTRITRIERIIFLNTN